MVMLIFLLINWFLTLVEHKIRFFDHRSNQSLEITFEKSKNRKKGTTGPEQIGTLNFYVVHLKHTSGGSKMEIFLPYW